MQRGIDRPGIFETGCVGAAPVLLAGCGGRTALNEPGEQTARCKGEGGCNGANPGNAAAGLCVGEVLLLCAQQAGFVYRRELGMPPVESMSRRSWSA